MFYVKLQHTHSYQTNTHRQQQQLVNEHVLVKQNISYIIIANADTFIFIQIIAGGKSQRKVNSIITSLTTATIKKNTRFALERK